ncbi:MAG TPA: hypothetical protein VG326_05455 [Tepidisphaeraceae bacterium]|nr:hypothetical protein [Tepidisphaeraceae bacterium]
MTPLTQENLAMNDSLDAASQTDDALQVEIWGPPGNGKSVLLVSIVETLRSLDQFIDYTMSPHLHTVRNDLIDGLETKFSQPDAELKQQKKEGEEISVMIPMGDGNSRKVRIVSRAGEDLYTSTRGIDVPKFTEGRKGKVLVVCLNPFKIDSEMAWKGLNQLIAALQTTGLDLPSAFESAVWTLFQVRPEVIANRPNLKRLLSAWSNSEISYEPAQSDPAKRFVWKGINQGSKDELCNEMRQLIDRSISLQGPLVDVVRLALRRIENSVVVLTHVDLIDAVLPSITFTDLERVYNYLFKERPERMVSQQAVARLFEVEMDKPYNSRAGAAPEDDDDTTSVPGGSRAMPLGVPNAAPGNGDGASVYSGRGGIRKVLRKDGAVQLVNYLRAIAKRGTEPATVQVTKLTQQLIDAANELKSAQRNQHNAESLLEQTRSALEQERTARAQSASDAQKLDAMIREKTRQIEKAQQDLNAAQSERQELATQLQEAQLSLRSTNSRLSELGPAAELAQALRVQLESEQRQSRDGRASVQRLEDEKNELRKKLDMTLQGGNASQELAMKREAEVRQANQERMRLEAQIASLTAQVSATKAPEIQGDLDGLQRERDELRGQLVKAQNELARSASRIQALERPGAARPAPAAANTLGMESLKRRDDEIDSIRQQLQNKNIELSKVQIVLKEAQLGRISPDEARQRDAYERGRMGAFKMWSLLMLRSLPVLPFLAAAAAFIVFTVNRTNPFNSAGSPFMVCSLIAIIIAALASLVGVGFQAAQLSPRWIWLRSISLNAPRTIEALTSGGEKLNSSPNNFLLERSPLLSILGIGIVRCNDSGQRYVTSELGAWLGAPEKIAKRWLVILDLVTLFVLALWVLAIVLLLRQ